ncbi:reverse transcriptase domain-containing protein [Tanacetum coccineum]
MPFGLRNAEATYQRLVDRAFHGQIGRNLEVYVDDLVIKSHTEDEVVREIEETFRTLRKINMKLNPKKCTFGVEEGMFLGYQVNTKGIKICPDKVDAVLSLQSPKCLKDVQKLNGKLASLNRFLAKSAEKSLPFFKTLKKCTKKSDFLWTEEAESAFKQMKELIAKLPMLIAPEEKEELIIYLAASKEAVSAVLMTEREAKQMPIYFVSRALRGPEVNYTSMEKLVLALVHASKRLRRYFQAHPIVVITDQPIKNILSNPEVAGQVLADFIVERPEEEDQDASAKEEEPLPAQWTLFTDSLSCVDGCEAGVILMNPEGIEFAYALRFQFKATNNEAEYEALIAGLWIAKKMGVQNLQVNVDSKLVVNQVNETYIAKETDMVKYLEKVKTLAKAFWEFSINQVSRKENKKADALSKMTSTSFVHLSKQVLVEELKEKSVNEIKANRSLGEGIKARLGKDNKNWLEEISHVLWAHRTMIKSSKETLLCSLTYRKEGCHPCRKWNAHGQTAEVDVAKNDEALEINLELLEEKREQAAIREEKSKRQIEKYYNTKVRSASFKPGDLVYRSNEASRVEDTGKLGPKWEGPYEVTEALGKGSYKLKDRNGRELPRTWNVCNLKKCYIHKM